VKVTDAVFVYVGVVDAMDGGFADIDLRAASVERPALSGPR